MSDCEACGDTGEVNHGSDYATPCACTDANDYNDPASWGKHGPLCPCDHCS